MTSLVFYEKPGCATNRRQKQLLQEAGFQVQARDLLGESWSREQLRAFLNARPVAEWFNLAAPAVKAGKLDPQRLDAEQALDLLLAQPLLIRRPLISVGSLRMAGFDLVALNALLPEEQQLQAPAAPIDSCSRQAHGHSACRSAEES